MKRLHVHVGVPDVAKSIAFYATLFGARPTVVKPDYAKWMLEDPRVNFAISSCSAFGVDHLGVEVESAEELHTLAERLKAAGADTLDETAAHCCYASSDKSWVRGPSGVWWETFFSFGETAVYGEPSATEAAALPVSCCEDRSRSSACC
jgi:catechol 2,3-dioxygenase-like lactoylglutathione lyase family enzyme